MEFYRLIKRLQAVYKMLNLDHGEKILMILHHHWISFAGPLSLVIILFMLPAFLLPLALGTPSTPVILPYFFFLASIWYLLVLFLALGFWMDYYLDALVITDKRILNVNQTGLFRHVVSEFRLEKVQDVTIEVPNFLGTAFHFGNIRIHTAGEVSFSIMEVPNPHEARDLILKYSRSAVNPMP